MNELIVNEWVNIDCINQWEWIMNGCVNYE